MSSHSTPTTQPRPSDTVEIPPGSSSLSQAANKKRKRSPDDQATQPQSLDRLLEKTYQELAVFAFENSKGSMSEADRKCFLDFYEEQRKMLVIKAIERKVSVPMVDGFLVLTAGISTSRPQKREQYFERVTNGIDHELAMKKVSELWQQLSPEEKKAFSRVSAFHDDGLTAEERALDEDDNDDDDSPPPGGPNVRSEASFKDDYFFVQNYVNDFIKKATHIATSRNVEFALFAVSKHLGPSMFQITHSTPGAGDAVQCAQDVDAENHYAARLQAHITGCSVTKLRVLATAPSKQDIKNPAHSAKVTARMKNLIISKTEGIMKRWPWKRTQHYMSLAGFRLVISPNARINPQLIQNPSRGLLVDQVTALHLDLDENLIDVVRITRSADDTHQ
ncbi:hypothetical protein PGT21_021673 [Puccinia graminis f. sp. tritici]|uniref:Uncharacterized protein n=1 Tax=Puccinia graminis f. sp. tritici TaxID=56615 RepID=A0A5B0QBG1_PUCGR|nr:hypothetical protein PGT21_021673 [Puccinia graminis f. sp. tritici]